MERMDFEGDSKFWHLCTPGSWPGVLFKEREDYVFGMNMVAMAAYSCRAIKIYTFQLMSNHLHFVISGKECDVLEFFSVLKRLLLRLWNRNAGERQVQSLEPRLFLIDERRYLLNVIAYVNRNGYVTDSSCTPFSYEWGANMWFFNGLRRCVAGTLFATLKLREKRIVFKKKDLELPAEWYLTGGYISPECYCDISTAETYFRNAHHYFSVLSKGVESFAEIAKEMGDEISYTDNELYKIVAIIYAKEYGGTDISLLSKNDKLSLAVKLRKEYNAGLKQLSRILKLDMRILESLFPNLC